MGGRERPSWTWQPYHGDNLLRLDVVGGWKINYPPPGMERIDDKQMGRRWIILGLIIIDPVRQRFKFLQR